LRHEHGIRDVQAYTIGLSINENIKLRTRRRLRKGHIYIHSAKSLPEPLTRVRNSAVTPPKIVLVTTPLTAATTLGNGDTSI